MKDFRNFFHNRINESVVRIPLVMKFPRSMNLKGVIDDPVTHVDILPTIYSLVPEITFSPDEEKLDGKNLLPLLTRKLQPSYEEEVNKQEAAANVKKTPEVVKAEDSEKVKKRLEALGYL